MYVVIFQTKLNTFFYLYFPILDTYTSFSHLAQFYFRGLGFPLPFTLVFFTLLVSVLLTVFFPFINDFFRLAAASLAFNTASLDFFFCTSLLSFLLPADAFFSVTFLLVVLVLLLLLLLPFLLPLPRFLPTAGRPFVFFLSFLPFPLPLPLLLPLPPRP